MVGSTDPLCAIASMPLSLTPSLSLAGAKQRNEEEAAAAASSVA